MLLVRRPSTPAIARFVAAQSRLGLTYHRDGTTGGKPPPGYVVDHTRGRIGAGERTFRAGQAALRRWEQFSLRWVEVCSPDTPLEPGRVVAVLAHVLGCWSLNACRIVTVVDEETRFGFAYGTLPGHAESGEERFLIEWDRDDDSVWYDILAFSRPQEALARLGYPYVRRKQRQFARDSVRAMIRAVACQQD